MAPTTEQKVAAAKARATKKAAADRAAATKKAQQAKDNAAAAAKRDADSPSARMARARAVDAAEKKAGDAAKKQADAKKKADGLRAEAKTLRDRAARFADADLPDSAQRVLDQALAKEAEADKVQGTTTPAATPSVPRTTAPAGNDAAGRAQGKLGGQEGQALDPHLAADTGGDVAARVIAAAESALGVDYLWGGNNLSTGVDCSGLVQQAFRAAGIVLPRVSAAQAQVGEVVPDISLARPGDLLSWNNSSRNAGADHIAIYLGNGMMIESPKPGAVVRVVPVRDGVLVNRVIGAVKPRSGVAAPVLGPNQDRRYSIAVAQGAAVPAVGADTTPDTGPMGGGVGDGLPPNATPAQVDTYIRTHYSDVAPFLANDEIKKIAYDAARDDLAPDEVTHRFEQTDYYKTHGATSRRFDELIGTDGAQAGIVVGKAKDVVSDLFARNGIALDDVKLGQIAKQSIRNGWIDTTGAVVNAGGLQDFLAYSIEANNEPLAGETGASAAALGATAKEWGIALSDATIRDWSLKILQGSATEATFQNYVTGLARGMWHGDEQVMAAIDAGISPTKFFDPHRQAIAKALELSPDQVDLFNDPSWRAVTEMWDPKMNGGKGANRAASVGEAAQMARNRPEYTGTTAYKDTKASGALQLVKDLGLVA